jgi:hypothetical protein
MRAILSFLLVVLVSDLSLAEDGPFPVITIMGKWSCAPPTVTIGSIPIPPPVDCKVNFARKFGELPQLMVFQQPYTRLPFGVRSGLTPIDVPLQLIEPKEMTVDGFTLSEPANYKMTSIYSVTTGYNFTGSWIATGRAALDAVVAPKYLVLSVLYAPPGMKGPKGTGFIDYQQGNTSSIETSASKSFKQDNSSAVSQSAGFWGNGAGSDLSFDYSTAKDDKQSLDITISNNISLDVKAVENENGVNNDNDVIVLLLRPQVNITMGISTVLWYPINATQSQVTRVSIAWLKNPSQFQKDAPNVKKLLEDNDVTEKDYPDILDRDPLASGAPPQANRFEKRGEFDYIPPTPCSETPVTSVVTLGNASTSTSEQTITDQYEVDASYHITLGADAGADVNAALQTKMTQSEKWTWTTASSRKDTKTTSSSVTMSVGGPSCGWTKSPKILFYYDKVYGTYAFREP